MFIIEAADGEPLLHQDARSAGRTVGLTALRRRGRTARAAASRAASDALAADASDNCPRGPTQSPAIQTLSKVAARDGGRPVRPPWAAVIPACVTVRDGRYCLATTRSRQPGCIISITVSSSTTSPCPATSPGHMYFETWIIAPPSGASLAIAECTEKYTGVSTPNATVARGCGSERNATSSV